MGDGFRDERNDVISRRSDARLKRISDRKGSRVPGGIGIPARRYHRLKVWGGVLVFPAAVGGAGALVAPISIRFRRLRGRLGFTLCLSILRLAVLRLFGALALVALCLCNHRFLWDLGWIVARRRCYARHRG